MNAPTTELRKTVRVDGGRLWWRSPGFIGSASAGGVPSGEAASAVYRPTSGDSACQVIVRNPRWLSRPAGVGREAV